MQIGNSKAPISVRLILSSAVGYIVPYYTINLLIKNVSGLVSWGGLSIGAFSFIYFLILVFRVNETPNN